MLISNWNVNIWVSGCKSATCKKIIIIANIIISDHFSAVRQMLAFQVRF